MRETAFQKSQLRAVAAGLGVRSSALLLADEVDEFTPTELEQLKMHGPMTCVEAQAHAKSLESIICWYVDSDDIQLEAYHWPAIQAMREALGRPLEAEDLRSIIEAQSPRSVRIVRPGESGRSWRVELHAPAMGVSPYEECYLACSCDAALRVAGHLLRGETVPRNYRTWV